MLFVVACGRGRGALVGRLTMSAGGKTHGSEDEEELGDEFHTRNNRRRNKFAVSIER